MHEFPELAERAATHALAGIREHEDRIVELLQTTAQTSSVKTLQALQLHRAIVAIGMFSIFEAMLQGPHSDGYAFQVARASLERQGLHDLKGRFDDLAAAVNVLKHGRGNSYNALVAKRDQLPFRIKGPGEHFFCEGDVSEVSTLVLVDDEFVMGCASAIREVNEAIKAEGRTRRPSI